MIDRSRAEDPGRLVARLRDEFDRTFSEPPPDARPADRAFVLVEAGERVVGVRSTDLRRVERLPEVVALPSEAPGLLGIISVRGAILGAHSLAALLSDRVVERRGGWALVCPGADVALVADRIHGYVRAGDSAIHPIESVDPGALVWAILHLDGVRYPLIDVAAVLQRIVKRTWHE